MLEHVHYDFSGNHILAAEMSRAIVNHIGVNDTYEPLSSSEVAERIGYPNHETIDNIKNLQGMIQHPPFPGQSNYTELERFLDDKLASVITEVGSPREVIRRRREAVNAGLVDWKVHFELAALNRNTRNKQQMYSHLNQLLALYPHNRESQMNLAEAMSQDGRWQDVIPLLERSLSYTRGDAKKIAETLGWLGTAYFQTGDNEKAVELLLEVPQKYPDEIFLSLQAYGNLIRHARQKGQSKQLDRYISDVQRYAESLIKDSKDDEYPLLYKRMSQLMTLGGKTAEAQQWAARQSQ